MLPTPLLLDFQSSTYHQTPTVSVPGSAEELALLLEPVYSDPTYYMAIHFPNNFNTLQGINPPLQVNNIKGRKVRLALPPSIGYGVNSAYRVEYWQYRRLYSPGMLLKTSKVDKKFIKEELWCIPTSDGSYLRSYDNYRDYRVSDKGLATVTLPSASLLEHQDIIVVKSIQGVTKYSITDNTNYLAKALGGAPTPEITLLCSDPAAAAFPWEVIYYKALTNEDVLVVDHEYMSIAANSRYLNLSTLLP